MANYVAKCRSSYFKVKDQNKFEDICNKWGLDYIRDDNDENLVGFMVDNGDGMLPVSCCVLNEETGEEELTYPDNSDALLNDISDVIEDGWSCIIMEVGAEKLRYLVGYAILIEPGRKYTRITLDDIYGKAEKKGIKYTPCEY